MVKLIGLILTATLLFGVCKASFNEEFCPEGSQLFLVDPNQDGTCPDVLPTVNTENEENKNKCEEDMNAILTKCGLCMEFGDTNMTKVESNPNYTQKSDVPCMETGERDITMNETTLDRYDWCAKLYQHYWYNHYYKYGWLKVVGAGSRLNLHSYLNDQTSSVRVRPGCTLKLFKHINYDWLLGSLTYDVSALTAYNDQASSLTCTCTGTSMYNRPGHVSLKKGDLVWSTQPWGYQFKVEYDVRVTKSHLPDLWHNIFHMTIGGNNGAYGDRIPAVWVSKDKYFHVSSAVSGNHNHYKNIGYQVNQWIHFEIKQEKKSNGQVIYSIKCDGVTVHEVVNTKPKRFGKVVLYLSDPWYKSFASFGELKNLKIVNLENH